MLQAQLAPAVCTNKTVRVLIGKADDLVAEIESRMGMIARKVGKVPKALADEMDAKKARVIFLTKDDFKFLNCKPGSKVVVRVASDGVEYP